MYGITPGCALLLIMNALLAMRTHIIILNAAWQAIIPGVWGFGIVGKTRK